MMPAYLLDDACLMMPTCLMMPAYLLDDACLPA